ncbi:MaoC/PaaZ C-terminal domain-containing protein [Streptomyces sp. NPDC051976]|uniref:MaoC/PaaZ C-terminal domain-containing protein n=1 Tax=Streptomyces sp. NPDC051976 TaxID=3154947 RepID=UPI0034166F42
MNLDAVGTTTGPVTVAWGPDDAILYALGVGAGQDDPLHDLALTTENSIGVPQRVLPTFGAILTGFRAPSDGSPRPRIDFGSFDPALLVHAEQSVAVARPLPTSGTMAVTTELVGIYDKGSGALVVTEARGRLPEDAVGAATVVTRSAVFIRGEGGFASTGPSDSWEAPVGEPDMRQHASTRRDQALLYQLSGDHNPLHTDPKFATKAGFERPILHGMCTYGVIARHLLDALADGDPVRFSSISGRFSRPVYPGDALTVNVWRTGTLARFRVTGPKGDVVLDRGTFVLREN